MKRTIALVTNLYPNVHEPSRGIYTKQLVNGLRRHFNLLVIAPVPWSPIWLSKKLGRSVIPAQDVIDGIEVLYPRYLVTPKLGRSCYGFFLLAALFPLLRRLQRERGIELVNAQWLYPDGFATVACCKKLGLPVVTHSLGCDLNEYARFYWRRKMIRYTLTHAKHNITVSAQLKQRAIALGANPDTTTAILNGVDHAIFHPADKSVLRKTLKLKNDSILLLFAGNFNHEKGLEVLLKAMPAVLKVRPNVHLVILGSGPLEKQITRLVSQLNIGSSLEFRGWTSHDRVPDYLAAVDYLCLPSLREGCPNIVLEALASATAVISTTVGAVPDILNSGIQTFTDTATPDDHTALAELILKAIARKCSVTREFNWPSWDDCAAQTATVFSNTLDQHAAIESR